MLYILKGMSGGGKSSLMNNIAIIDGTPPYGKIETIGGSGCEPTSLFIVGSTLTDIIVTPKAATHFELLEIKRKGI